MKKKKSSSLLNMIEKERHRVAASITREQEWEQPEPNSGLARMFVIMLLIHVFVIGGSIIYDFIGDSSSHSSQASASSSSTKELSSSPASIVSAAPFPMVSSASAPKPEPALVETPKVAETPAPEPQQPSPLSSMPKALAYTPPTEEKPAEEAKTESTPIVTAKANTNDPIAFHHQDEESDTMATNTPVTSHAGSSGLEKAASKAPEEKKVQSEKPKASSSSTESTRSKADKPTSKVADKPSSQPRPVAPPSVMRKALAGDGKPPAATSSKRSSKDESDPPSPKKASKPASNAASKHTIAKGETVYSLARRFKVSEAALMKANGIKNANALQIGKTITIPQSK